jgi:hypothetical protein
MEPGGIISAFNIHTLIRRNLPELPNNMDTKVRWNLNRSIFDRHSNSIWKLSYYSDTAVLEQIFLDGRTQKYSWPCFRNNIQHGHNAEEIKYDQKRNSIWVNSSDGLLEFSLNDKQFRKVDVLNEFTNSKDYARGVGIDIDPNGRIIFSTSSHGILIYDLEFFCYSSAIKATNIHDYYVLLNVRCLPQLAKNIVSKFYISQGGSYRIKCVKNVQLR